MSKSGRDDTTSRAIARRVERFVTRVEKTRDHDGYLQSTGFYDSPCVLKISMMAPDIRGRVPRRNI
jgi:hypothetical protein